MKRFKRKTRKITNEAIAGKIAAGIIRYQRDIANCLNQGAKNWTPRFRICIMIGCCMLFGLYFLNLLVRALQNL